MSTESCPFCRIASGEGSATILYRDELVVAFLDARPVAPMHVLIIPTQHVASVTDLKPEHGELLSRMTNVARQLAAAQGVESTGFRLVINTGPDAGQSVFHLHTHLIAGRKMHWPPG